MSNPPGNVRADPLTTILGTAEWLSSATRREGRRGPVDVLSHGARGATGARPPFGAARRRVARSASRLGRALRPRVRRDALRREEIPIEGNSSREGSLSDDGKRRERRQSRGDNLRREHQQRERGRIQARRGSARRTPPPRSLRRRTLAPPGATAVASSTINPRGASRWTSLGASDAGVPARAAGREAERDPSAERTPRGASLRDARARRADAGPALVCSLFARPPPGNAGIPGTAGGEGQARAAAAGAPPSAQRAPSKTTRFPPPPKPPNPDAPPPFSRVPPRRQRDARRDGSARGSSARRRLAGRVEPVALLRLFPAPSADHPPEEAFDAFDKLAARLTPADAAEVTTTDGASTPAAASTGTGTGGGSSSPRTPATRSSSRPSAAGGSDVATAKKHRWRLTTPRAFTAAGPWRRTRSPWPPRASISRVATSRTSSRTSSCPRRFARE